MLRVIARATVSARCSVWEQYADPDLEEDEKGDGSDEDQGT